MMDLVRRLLLAGLCAVLLGPVSGSVIAQAASDKPAAPPAQFQKVNVSGEDAGILCESIKMGDLKDIRNIKEKYNQSFTSVAMSSLCDESNALRYAFKIQNRKVWKYMIERLEVDINVGDAKDGYTIRDYLERRVISLKDDPVMERAVEIYRSHISELIQKYGAKNGPIWLSEKPEYAAQ